MKDFKTLQVWQRAHGLTLKTYRATVAFPNVEKFGLTSQIRRACSSISANVAEGCGREGDAELARFCQIAMGSASELEYHLLLAHDLGFLELSVYQSLNTELVEIRRMLNVFIQRLRSNQ
jgi:four helix bundle protein